MEKLPLKIAGEITLSENPGASLKKWREIFDVTQTELADHLGVTSSTISDYESNRRASPGTNIIQRFVEAIIEIDRERGGWTVKKLSKDEEMEEPFEILSLTGSMDSKEFVEEVIDGEVVLGEEKLEESKIYGCTLIDSLRAIVELPCDQFINIYGSTTERALVFQNVSMGRSPLVAVRVTELKPSMIVLHNVNEVDKIGKKIAKAEGVPLVKTILPIDQIKERVEEFSP